MLSHRSAAALWGIRLPDAGVIEVTVPRALRSRPRIRCHFAALATDETTTARGIPITTPPRTLLDLAALVSRHHLERALDAAEVLRLADTLSPAELLARHPGRPGVAQLRRILKAGRIGATLTRSELEDRFLAFLTASGLQSPETNVALQLTGGWIEADCIWREQRTVVELDGYASHGTRGAFERDRARDRRLQASGWRVVRVTWRHLHDEPGELARELDALLHVS